MPAGIGDALVRARARFSPPHHKDEQFDKMAAKMPRVMVKTILGFTSWMNNWGTLPGIVNHQPYQPNPWLSPQNKNYNNINFTFSWNHWNHQNKDVVRQNLRPQKTSTWGHHFLVELQPPSWRPKAFRSPPATLRRGFLWRQFAPFALPFIPSLLRFPQFLPPKSL